MLSGSIVALVTPMSETGDIDFDALHRLVDWHLESQTDAIVVTGSTGEAATLTPEERADILSAVVKQVAGRIPVVAGTGTNNTAQTVELTRFARDLGADAALVVVPYYNRPTQQGLKLHFKAVASIGLPIFLYNVPSRTACDLLPETVVELAEVKHIIGIKEASSLERCMTLLQTCPESFIVLSGEDGQAMASVIAGAKGVISVAANVVPEAMHTLMALASGGSIMEANQINTRLQPLYQALFCEPNPIPVKWALKEMGMMEPHVRLPLTLLSEEKRVTITRVLEETGVPCG
ncbi:MAG: 4-hydroxy-tetrahydrodipicolinate synthase [Gammaproteobacteria bacterium]